MNEEDYFDSFPFDEEDYLESEEEKLGFDEE